MDFKQNTYISPKAFGAMENKPVRVMTTSRKEFIGTLKLEWWETGDVKSVTIVKPNNTLVVIDKEAIEWIEEI